MGRSVLRHRVRQIRLARGLTQAQLAKKLGQTAAYVSHLETGTREPGVANLIALCKALGVSSDLLLGLSVSTGQALEAENARLRAALDAIERAVKGVVRQ